MRTSKIMSAIAIMSMVGGRASAKQLLTQNINLLYVRQLGNQKRPITAITAWQLSSQKAPWFHWLLLSMCLRCFCCPSAQKQQGIYSAMSSSSASGRGIAAASCSCFSYSACCCWSICTSGGARATCSTKCRLGSLQKKCCYDLEWPMQTYAKLLSGSMQGSTYLQVPARQHAFLCNSSADKFADAYS